MLKLYTAESPCCGDSGTVCQYVADINLVDGVDSIVVVGRDGENLRITVVDSGTTAASIKAAIITALAGAGYENSQTDNLESITVTSSGVVTIYADFTVVAVDNAGDQAFTQACTAVTLCTYTKAGVVSSTGNTLSVNGVQTALIDIVAGTTTTTQIDTSVTAALTASGITNASAVVTSTGSGGSTVYTIVITAPQATIYYNGTIIDPASCAQDWV